MIDNPFDDILDLFDTSSVKVPIVSFQDFQENLKYTAWQSIREPESLETIWCNFLSSILDHWQASVEIELGEATDILINAAGINLCPHVSPSDKGDFWYKPPQELYSMPKGVQEFGMIYMNIIAVFETINYWCWHDAPVSITFNKENLLSVLACGSITIDWSNY